MQKFWRKCGNFGLTTFTASSYPKRWMKLCLWNASPLPPVMLIVVFGISVISMGSASHTNNHANNRQHALHSHQGQQDSPSSSSSYHHTHLHRHQHDLAPDGDRDDGDNIIYECPDEEHPEDLETFMEKLTELGRKNKESGERVSSEGNRSISENLMVNQGDDCASPKSSNDSGNLWSPSDKLFGIKEFGTITQFRICPRTFNCTNDRKGKVFHWHPYWDDKEKSRYTSIQIPTTFQLSNMSLAKGGFLVWNMEKEERHVYRKEEYCISRRGKGGWLSFKVCAANCSDKSPCVRKCCPPSQVIGAETKKCIPANPSWRPIFYKSASEQDKNTDSVVHNASIIVGFLPCPKKYVINATPLNNFKLLLNGTLVHIDGSKQTQINVGEFCIDGIQYGEKNDELRSRGLPIKYSRSEWDQVVIACKPNTNRRKIDNWRLPLFATLNCVSALFLLLTDIVYLLLWRHQNIHGWLQFCYATSLFCTFSCFVVVQLWSYELLNISRSLCKVMGYMTHLTYLSAFFWLTSMNFDLWWRFSRPLRNSRMRPQERKVKRFLGFAAFSIGIPLLISSIGITLDAVYDGMLLDPPFTVPGVGKDMCYFQNNRSQVPYLYGPAGVLLLIDLIFFTSTVLHLRKMNAHTELARTQSTLEGKKSLRVILILFIIMGVHLVFELASWIAKIWVPDNEITLIWIFFPIDVLNCLQGVAIFFLFVCKPNVRNHLVTIFRRDDDDASKTRNKQIQHPSIATVHATIKPNDCIEMK